MRGKRCRRRALFQPWGAIHVRLGLVLAIMLVVLCPQSALLTNSSPSNELVLLLLMQVLFFDQMDYRYRVAEAFRAAILKPPLPPICGVDDNVCGTSVSFFWVAMDSVGYRISNFHRIDELSDMFHESHVKQRPGESVCEVLFMDVVLYRAILPAASESNDKNNVRVMRCF